MTEDNLAQLRAKYGPVIREMQQSGVHVDKSEMKDGKFFIKGEAPSMELKNRIWAEIKKIDAGHADLIADITVAAGQGGPGPGPAAAPESSYTVKAGDTLSKIAKDMYGDASAYMKIFNANKGTLSDPDKIEPGQVLVIPPK